MEKELSKQITDSDEIPVARGTVESIPVILYGGPSDIVYLYVHGRYGYKEEASILAEIACPAGFQVLGIDLPGHGERKDEIDCFDPFHAVPDLITVIRYAQERWRCICLYAVSIGAWFSMLAFEKTPPARTLFVSPVVDMTVLIEGMMKSAGITPEKLHRLGKVSIAGGDVLDDEYYALAREHKNIRWMSPTRILYAGGDCLQSRERMTQFVRQNECFLTVMEDGEHWFHTPEQLLFLTEFLSVNVGVHTEMLDMKETM